MPYSTWLNQIGRVCQDEQRLSLGWALKSRFVPFSYTMGLFGDSKKKKGSKSVAKKCADATAARNSGDYDLYPIV